MVNSLYDPANYGFVLDFPCSNLTTCNASMLQVAQNYRDDFYSVIDQHMVVTSPFHGYFATACNQVIRWGR